MVFLVLSLTSGSHTYNIFSEWGKRTVSILVFSGFAVKFIFKFITRIEINIASLQWYFALLVAIPISAAVILACGNKITLQIYNKLINKAAHLFVY